MHRTIYIVLWRESWREKNPANKPKGEYLITFPKAWIIKLRDWILYSMKFCLRKRWRSHPSVTDSSIGTEALPSQRMLACTQTVLLCFFSIIGERAIANANRANEHGARERKIKNVCRHLWEKRGLLSPSSMSTPHHFHRRVRSAD